MSPLGWLLGLVLPACAGTGAAGVPAQPPLDIAHLQRPPTPNSALAAPSGFLPQPDLPTPVYPVPPLRLFVAVQAVAAAAPRTYLQVAYPDRLQAHYVARSAVWNFPDLIAVQALPEGDGRSRLVLFSRSLYGRSDLGANKARLTAWLAALDTELHQTSEK